MENTLFSAIGMDERHLVICGTDEAGRGPLAGPVVAAAVVLPDDFPREILGDSKALSEKRRLEAEKIIKEKAVWAVASVSHREIDRINILNASMLAMRKAYMKVSAMTHVDLLLADGNRCPDVDTECRAIVKGDAKIPEIMAASILAKNERDRIMVLASAKWPGYGYDKHKGYPSKAHRDAILRLGPSPIQRLTFHTGLEKEEKQPELF